MQFSSWLRTTNWFYLKTISHQEKEVLSCLCWDIDADYYVDYLFNFFLALTLLGLLIQELFAVDGR